MKETDSSFIEQKNAKTNLPVWLYRVEILGDDDLYFAEYDEDIPFWELNSSVYTTRTYLAFPIRHSGISENTEGQIDQLTLSIGNVSREIQDFIEEHAGLRGNKVTIWKVYRENCADGSSPSQTAYVQAVYYIDSVVCNERQVDFTLSSKLDVDRVSIPLRIVTRDYCPWVYKGYGCWPGGSPIAEFDVEAQLINAFDKTASGDNTNPAQIIMTFPAIRFPNIDVSDSLLIELKCSDPTKISSNSQIEISSSGTHDTNELNYADLTTLGLTTSYATYEIPLASFGNTGGLLNWAAVNFFRVYCFFTSGTNTISAKNPRVKMNKPFGFTTTDLDTCRHTFVDCARHNNTRQFGGFPGVPRRRVF